MTRRDRLLAMVADRPEGAKVDIPAIIRAFTPTQASTIAMIERFIAEGKLDAKTLRRPIETAAEASHEAEPTEPPIAPAAEEGGGVARDLPAPRPDLDRLLECFGDDFETLRVVAMRFGAASPQKIVRYARMLHARCLVEQAPPVNGQPFCLWRRAQQNTKEAPGTARDAPRAAESTAAKRTKGRASIEEPAPAIASSARARPVQSDKEPTAALRGEIRAFLTRSGMPSTRFAREAMNDKSFVYRLGKQDLVFAKTAERIRKFIADWVQPIEPPKVDLKVNAKPRVRRVAPVTHGNESVGFQRQSQKAMRTNRENAEAFLDSGKTSADARGVSLKIEARKVEIQRAEDARRADPVEQAKLKLARRHAPVCGAEIMGGPKGKFMVGRKLVTKAELLAMAARIAA